MRIRTVIGFIGGLLVALFVGLVPSELIGWLRDSSARGGPDTLDSEASAESRLPGKRRRGARKRR